MSNTHFVSEAEGNAGIQQKLLRAQPGDTVRLGPGTYNLEDACVIPTGVTFSGSGRETTFLTYALSGAAITATDAAEISVKNLAISATNVSAGVIGTVDNGNEISSGNESERAIDSLIFFYNCENICVKDVTLIGAHTKAPTSGACAHLCNATVFERVTISGFPRDGLQLLSYLSTGLMPCSH